MSRELRPQQVETRWPPKRAQKKDPNSYVETCLNRLVADTPRLSPHPQENIDIIFSISIMTSRPTYQQKSARIKIENQFYPSNKEFTEKMDDLVDILRLDIRARDVDLRFIPLASLAGCYLCVIFPSGKNRPTTPRIPQLLNLVDENTEVDLRSHIVKYSILRFSELSQDLLQSLRGLDLLGDDFETCKKIIAAAGVLYCEMDDALQGFYNGTRHGLCNDIYLERALKSWLKDLCEEISLRLRNTCPKFPIWAESLDQPWSNARRYFGMDSITLSLEMCSRENFNSNSGTGVGITLSHAISEARSPKNPQAGPEVMSFVSSELSDGARSSQQRIRDVDPILVPSVATEMTRTWSLRGAPVTMSGLAEFSQPLPSLNYSYYNLYSDQPSFWNSNQQEEPSKAITHCYQSNFPTIAQPENVMSQQFVQSPWSGRFKDASHHSLASDQPHCPCCRFHQFQRYTLRGLNPSPCSQASFPVTPGHDGQE
ncbi:hypothetical protein G7Y89_g11150 [Cudoniella acicularis]|uniref:Uncharacterized protein n=1 Tax=Cudoniella acicularis TaxID=354080 RepID=A0A8H4RE71_9HELO|nr:hypothetical protein G7Y89_g11150 [Cudoniella acicularis]